MADANGETDSYSVDPDYQDWKEGYEARKRSILAATIVRQHLDVLSQAGADASKVLSLLGLIVPASTDTLTSFFAKKQRELTALANKAEQLSNKASGAIADPTNSSGFWKACLFPAYEEFRGTEHLTEISKAANQRMKPIIDLLRAEAKQFGALRRNYEQLMSTLYLSRLLGYVKESTGQFHEELMADLLQAAHNAVGIDESFSGVQLRKLRQRRMPYLVRTRKGLLDSDNALGLMLGMGQIKPPK